MHQIAARRFARSLQPALLQHEQVTSVAALGRTVVLFRSPLSATAMAFDLVATLARARETGVLSLASLGLTSVPRAALEPPLALLLRRLDLSHNDLRFLPPELGALRNLEELFLNDNPLKALPSEIEGCLSLKVIDLRETHVAQLPPSLGRLPNVIDINLLHTRLDPRLQEAYARGGVLRLLGLLNERDTRRELEEALRTTLTVDVYREAADTAAGKARVAQLVADCLENFGAGENAELRTVVRNAARLFNADVHRASAAEVRERLTELMRGNVRKALAADVELKLRAVYYGRLDVTKVEGIVHDVMACLPELEDAQFLLEHATKLLPKEAKDVRGAALYERLCALRAAMAQDRAAAIATLVKSLMNVYPDREPHHCDALARAVARLVKKADDVRMLASDAAELFPPELNAAKPKLVYRAFLASKAEKGI